MGRESVTDCGDDQKAQVGWEEKAANVLNGVMVMAIGLAVGALGVWVLWRFAAAVRIDGFGPDTNWMEVVCGAFFVMTGVRVLRFAARMHRPERT